MMTIGQGIIWIVFIPTLLQMIDFSQALEVVMCYDCTSWNPYCANSVKTPFPGAVAIVECNITKTCYIQKERDGMISRGCADWWMFSSVDSDYLGCQEQVPLWMQPQEWCFCDTNYCNGKSMDDIRQLNGPKHYLHLQNTKSQDAHSKEDNSSDRKKNKVREQVVHSSSVKTTILPWWWWHVHWPTQKLYWLEEDDKKQKRLSHDGSHHKNTNEEVINSKEIFEPQVNLQETSPKRWENSKRTTFSDWWDVPAFPTRPVGIQEDKQEGTKVNSKQNLKDEGAKRIDIEQKDNFEKDFFCWDCYSDNPYCGKTVKTPVAYYVGQVACPVTQKCFIRKDKGVIYRGCADGWKDSSIDYVYVGCKNQTMWDRNVEWCFCSSPYCNVQSMDSLRDKHPIIFNTANEQGQGIHKKMDDK